MSDQQHIPGMPSSNDEQYPQSEAMQPRQPLPGVVLAGERQARGWSVEYVASHLKLAIRQIHALEEDRYEALPSPVVIRGFVRIYAKMLGIDSTTLVAALPTDPVPANAQIRPSRTLSTPFSESSLPLRGQHELPLARIAWITFGVLVVAVLFAALKYGNWDRIKNSSLLQRLHMSGAAAKEIVVAPSVDNIDQAVKPAVAADSESVVPSEVASSTPAPATSTASAKSATSAAPETAAVTTAAVTTVAPTAAPTAAPNGAPNTTMTPAPATPLIAANLANPLQLTISQDSWIEIRRADKSIVVSRVMKAGTTEAFDISAPMSLIVGNAAGVDASLRGKPLALASTAANNVARLDLK